MTDISKLKILKASLLLFILVTGTAGGYCYLEYGAQVGAFGAILSYQVFFSAMILDYLSYIVKNMKEAEVQ